MSVHHPVPYSLAPAPSSGLESGRLVQPSFVPPSAARNWPVCRYRIPHRDNRRRWVRCIADCDMCGLCTVFRGKDPEVAYADYINGKRVYLDVSKDYR